MNARSVWGAAPPKWRETFQRSQGVFIHYNGPAVSAAVLSGDRQAVVRFLQGIQRFHMNTQGWPDIAYSFSVDAAGRVWELRGWGVVQAATLNWNSRSHSIFLPVGGDQSPTPAQTAAARSLVAEHDRRFGRGFVKGHREAPNSTSCPGEPTMRLLRAGSFDPYRQTSIPAPTVPAPPGVDVTVSKPLIINERPGGNPNAKSNGSWVYYENTPWRIRIKTADDFRVYRGLGVPVHIMSPEQHAFFRRNTNEVKTG